jgi:hypothetical protein
MIALFRACCPFFVQVLFDAGGCDDVFLSLIPLKRCASMFMDTKRDYRSQRHVFLMLHCSATEFVAARNLDRRVTGDIANAHPEVCSGFLRGCKRHQAVAIEGAISRSAASKSSGPGLCVQLMHGLGKLVSSAIHRAVGRFEGAISSMRKIQWRTLPSSSGTVDRDSSHFETSKTLK